MKQTLSTAIASMVADQATGCHESRGGLGTLYAKGGVVISPAIAKQLLLEGNSIEVPNAGAGSYQKFFVSILGFEEVQTVETTASSGDWTLGVKIDGLWYAAYQTNRYPNFGFKYSLSQSTGDRSFETLCQRLMI